MTLPLPRKTVPSDSTTLQDVPDVPVARLGRALQQGLREVWDKLGLVIGMSLTWTLLLTLPLTVERLLPHSWPALAHLCVTAGLALLWTAGPLAGGFDIAHCIATHEEVSYGDFWHSARQLFAPALRLAALDTLVFIVLGLNLWFYVRLGNVAGTLAALVCLYVLLFWGMMAVYHFPLLVVQERGVLDEPDKRAKRGAVAACRRAFYLALGSPFYTLGLLAVVVPVTLVCVVSGVLLALVWLGLLALLITHATRALLVQFGALPPPVVEEVVPDAKFRIQ